MGDAGGELAEHRQLAGLHQFVLGGAQGAFGPGALRHFFLQAGVGGGEVGRALLHLAFQLVVGLLQGFPGGQPVPHMAAAFVEHEGQDAQEGGADAGQGGPVGGDFTHLLLVGENGDGPGGARQGLGLGQELAGHREHGNHLWPGLGQAHQTGAVVQFSQLHHPQGVEGAAVVLLGLVEGTAGGIVQGLQGGEFPVRHRGQDDHAVLVRHQGRSLHGGPGLFQLLQAHLEHRHAHRALGVGQGRGQVVTRLASGGADAEEAAAARIHGLAEIGAEGEVFPQVAIRAAPVAGGHDPAIDVEDVDGKGAGPLVELLEV